MQAENEMVFMRPSTADGYWTKELDIFQSRTVPSPLAQLRSIASKMRSKKSRDHKGPAAGKEIQAGFYGGHNPSGRIRILKL